MQKDPPVPIASGFRYNDQNPSKNDMSVSFFEETIEITDDYYERVEIPKFDECENAIVLHDFERVSLFYLFSYYSVKVFNS